MYKSKSVISKTMNLLMVADCSTNVKWLKTLKNGWKRMKTDENCWKWLWTVETVENGWKSSKTVNKKCWKPLKTVKNSWKRLITGGWCETYCANYKLYYEFLTGVRPTTNYFVIFYQESRQLLINLVIFVVQQKAKYGQKKL